MKVIDESIDPAVNSVVYFFWDVDPVPRKQEIVPKDLTENNLLLVRPHIDPIHSRGTLSSVRYGFSQVYIILFLNYTAHEKLLYFESYILIYSSRQ